MMLGKILETKREEVAVRKAQVPLRELKARVRDLPPLRDFHQALNRRRAGGRIRLIAEIKKASPSHGIIRADFDPEALASSYAKAGAAALSVLTDGPFFEGSLQDLVKARAAVSLPVLRKDFTIDPYQVYETRVRGADAILLIVAALTPELLQQLLGLSLDLGLHPLTEVHTQEEVGQAVHAKAPILGVNNRDLKTFRVSLETTFALLPHIPPGRLVVSESGISRREEMMRLEAAGVDAVLVGEGLLRSPDVRGKIRELMGDEDVG
jgi:indole-3-glycerol phosphate synthase